MVRESLAKIKIMAAAAAVLAALSAAGCGMQRGSLAESAAASEAAEGPDLSVRRDVKLDFDEAQESCDDLIADGDYELSSYIDTYVDEEKKIVNLIWPLSEAATEEDGVRYANAIVRAFNDACAEQDFSIALSDENSYGGLYQKYAVNVQVFREGDILSPEKYFVSMTIPAGSGEAIVPFARYDGVNEVILSDGPAMIPGGQYGGGEPGTESAADQP